MPSRLEAECDFCEPQELAWRTINEDEHMRSFLSDPRLRPGHALVTTVEHHEPPEPMSGAEMLAIIRERERLKRALLLSGFAMGVDAWQKSRPAVPERPGVPKRSHYHEHVVPSSPGDPIYENMLLWTPDQFGRLSREEAEMVLEILRP